MLPVYASNTRNLLVYSKHIFFLVRDLHLRTNRWTRVGPGTVWLRDRVAQYPLKPLRLPSASGGGAWKGEAAGVSVTGRSQLLKSLFNTIWTCPGKLGDLTDQWNRVMGIRFPATFSSVHLAGGDWGMRLLTISCNWLAIHLWYFLLCLVKGQIKP